MIEIVIDYIMLSPLPLRSKAKYSVFIFFMNICIIYTYNKTIK